MKTLAEKIEEHDRKAAQGDWAPASGGTEEVFLTRSGVRMLYCYQPSTGAHAYLNVDTDIFLTNEEAQSILNF